MNAKTILITLIIILAGCSILTGSELNPLARSIQVDLDFAYYKDRSRESIVSEIQSNGYNCVRLAVTRDSTVDAEFVNAAHKSGMAVWYTTFANGVYSTAELPVGWEKWRMKLRDTQPHNVAAGFVYLCLNNPDYRKWKRESVAAVLKRVPFDAFEFAEPSWPAYRGPESPSYGCLCGYCEAAFLKINPDESSIPNFTDTSSLVYYKNNPALYQKWVDFRTRSVVDFYRYMFNDPGGIRRTHPNLKCAVWGIADDVPDPVRTIREWAGIDCALLAKEIKPDLFIIQTDWPDWGKPDLAPDYALKYKPFADAVRSVSQIPIQMQTDIGSWENCIRGSRWIRKCEEAARKAGISEVIPYEYHLSLDLYVAAPRPIRATISDHTVILTFNKRLDAAKAADTDNYSVDIGKVVSASPDGSLVRLVVTGKPRRITVRNLSDDHAKRLFGKQPAVTMPAEVSIAVRQ